MADEKTVDAASVGSRKKKLLIGAAAAVVVLALAVTAWFLLASNGSEEAAEAEPEDLEELAPDVALQDAHGVGPRRRRGRGQASVNGVSARILR